MRGERIRQRHHSCVKGASRNAQWLVRLEHKGEFRKVEATHVHERAGALLHGHVRRMRKGIAYFAKRHKPKWRG
jgi:hypothetical protein